MDFSCMKSFYQNFQVFQEENLPDNVGTTIHTAGWINKLSGRTVFDAEAMKRLTETPTSLQIEEYYKFMLGDLVKRNEIYHVLQDKYSLHVLVSDFLEISTSVLGKDAVIIMEWPYIKYMDMLNKEICYAKPTDFEENIELLLQSFADKYIHKTKADRTFHLRRGDDPLLFQMRSYMRNIQELFMQGHELGHLLLRDGNNTEQEADRIAFHAVLGYCKQELKIMPFILSSIMLLFTYMTWLDSMRKILDEGQEETIKQWKGRYDSLFDIMIPYYESMDEKDKDFVNGYDRLCDEIDRIGTKFLKNAKIQEMDYKKK